MTWTKKTIATTLLVGAMAPLQTQASLLAYEGFAYEGTDLVGANGGAGWSGGWQGIYNNTGAAVNTDNLFADVNSPTGYDTRSTGGSMTVRNNTGVGRQVDCGASGIFAQRGFLDGNRRIGKDGKTLYISFLQQPNTTIGNAYYEWRLHRGNNLGDGGRIAGIGNDTGVDNNVYLRAPNGTKNLPLGAASTGVNFYVMKIVYKAGNDDIHVYHNPTGANEAANTPTLTRLAQADMSFDGIAMAAFNGGGVTVSHDQIRIGETWEDVIGGPPGFTIQPKGFVTDIGGSGTLSTLAISDQTVSYQWYKGGQLIPGATGATLELSGLQLSDAGIYTVVASNALGTNTSVGVTVSVMDPNNHNLLAYEGFDYPGGSQLVGQNGGAGWDGVWQSVNNASALAVSGSLIAEANSPSGYDARSTGNSVINNNNTRTGRSLDTSANGTFGSRGYVDGFGRIGADGKVLYLSFLQQPSTTVGGAYYEFEFHRDNLGDPGRIAGIGNDSGVDDTVNLRAPNGVKNLLLGTANTGVNFYIVKIVFNSGNDDIYVYRNPTGANEADNTPTLVKLDQADMSFNGLSMGTFNSGCTVNHDQIRLGESWASVVGGPSGFIEQPKGFVARSGDSNSLTAAALSDLTVNYQWFKGNSPIPGATSATLSFPSIRLSDAGNYKVVAANALGSVTSVVASVSVLNTNSYLLCYEGFDYNASLTSIAGMNGGAGWSGGWVGVDGNGGIPVNSGSLVADGKAPAGYDARSTGNSSLVLNANRAGRYVDCSADGVFGINGLIDPNGRIGADGTSLYISFLQQPIDPNNTTNKFYEFEFHRDHLGDPGRTAGIGNDQGNNPSVFLRGPNSTLNRIGDGDPAVNFYIMRIDFVPGPDTVYVYRNPLGSTEAANTPTLVKIGLADMSFNGISLAAFDNNVTVKHDQIRMGLSWGDVVGGAPGFIVQPVKQLTNYANTTATLTAFAASDLPVSYQWYHGTTAIPGATSATLSIPNAQAADTGIYWVTASNALGSVTSTKANLSLIPLAITNHPGNQLVYLNKNKSITLNGGAGGYQVAYQWYLNGKAVPGATSSSLVISDLQMSNAGDYYLVASNGSGSVTSSVATVTIYGRNNTVFAYDGFDYDGSGEFGTQVDGASQNGGFGWTGPWGQTDNANVYIVPNSLVGGANVPAIFDTRAIGNCVEVYGMSRSGRYLDCSPTGQLAKQGFLNGDANVGADGKTIYVSFLQQPMTTDLFYEFEFHRGDLSDPGRIAGIGNDTATPTVSLRAGGMTTIGDGDINPNFYVVRIDYKAGNDDIYVYRNPTSLTEPTTPTLTKLNASDMAFNGLSVAAYVNNDVKHDEIRVGATWEDVIGVTVSNLLPPTKTTNGCKVRFACTPKYSYTIQRAPAVTGPWNNITTVTGSDNAYVEFEDTTAPDGQSFYRTVSW